MDPVSGGSRISPRRGRQLPRGGANIRNCQISEKLHEIERIWTPGGARVPRAPPLDPPMPVRLSSSTSFSLRFEFGLVSMYLQ